MIGGKHADAQLQQEALLPDLSKVPLVLEWAMNSTTSASLGAKDTTARCPTATDGARSACLSKHSSCKEVQSPFHHGYACLCLPGYHGNPYLTDGWQG